MPFKLSLYLYPIVFAIEAFKLKTINEQVEGMVQVQISEDNELFLKEWEGNLTIC